MPVTQTKLIKEFKALARKVGTNRFFWELMVDEMLKGGIPSLDVGQHVKNPKTIEQICQNLHQILLPKEPYNKKNEAVYLKIIQTVKKDLDF